MDFNVNIRWPRRWGFFIWPMIYAGMGVVTHLILVGDQMSMSSAWSLAALFAWPVLWTIIGGALFLLAALLMMLFGILIAAFS